MAKSRKYYEEKKARISDRLDLYYAAEKAILDGAQSYTIGNRQINRGSLSDIRKMIEALEDQLASIDNILNGGSARKAFAVVPRDF